MSTQTRGPFRQLSIVTVAIALLTVGLAGVGAAQSIPDLPLHPRSTWVENPDNPVHNPTEGRAYYPTVILDDGTYKMWHTGNSEGGFGLEMATSQDGTSWSEPVDASDGLQGSGFVSEHHAHVEQIGDHFRVWYWDCCQRDDISVLRTATSTDGTAWTDDQPLQQVDGEVVTGEPGSAWNRFALGLDEVIYNPAGSDTIVSPEDPQSVLQNRFIGFFGNSNGGQQFVGLAVSADGVTWEAYQDGAQPIFSPSGDGWDATHVYPGTVVAADGFHMWYSGGDGSVKDGVGYAFSPNGVDWTRAQDPIFHVSDGEDWRTEETYTPTVIPETGQMWFSGEAPEPGDGFDDDPTVGYAQGLPLPGAG